MFFRNLKVFKIHLKDQQIYVKKNILQWELNQKSISKLKNQLRFNYNLPIIYHKNKSMSSDQEVAFQNWQDAAEQLEKEELNQKEEVIQQQQTNQEQPSDALNQQQKAEKQPEDPKETLRKKIAQYQKMEIDQFQQISEQVTEINKTAAKKIGNPILKSDKDFNNYAKILAKRFDNMVQNEDATIDEDKLSLFFQELTLYMYKNLEWKNLHEVQSKLKVIKKQRKTEEDKRRKQKEKQERLKKVQGEASESQSQSVSKQQKKQEDLFGGVSIINSKQEEEERKNKIITEEAKKQEKKEEEDDDDFM